MLRGPRRLRHERSDIVVPPQLAAGLAEQMHRRRPAAGHRHQIHRHALPRRQIREWREIGPAHAVSSAGAAHHGLRPHPRTGIRCTARRRPGLRPRIGNDHLGARFAQCQSRRVSAVVVGRDDHAFAGQHRVLTQIPQHRRGRHHAGAVIVREYQGPLDRAGRQHHATRAYVPQSLFAPARRGIGALFDQADRGVVVISKCRSARQQRDVAKRGDRRINPCHRRRAVNRSATPAQRPAPAGTIINQHDPQSGGRRRPRRRQPGRTAAHDQNVAVRVARLVVPRVDCLAQSAQPGHATDRRLVAMPVRRHERLVVKPRRQEAMEEIEHPEEIVPHIGKTVRAARHHARPQTYQCGASVRVVPVVPGEIDDGVRLFRAGAIDAARAMEFETAPDHAHVVRQQGRGQRVAGEAEHRAAFPGEGNRCVAVDKSALGQTPHAAPPGFSLPSTAWLTVSRSTTNHWPQPPAWHQISRCGPFTLLRKYR